MGDVWGGVRCTAYVCMGAALRQAIGRALGCYKVMLDCSRDNVDFYKRCGFKEKEVQMAIYLPLTETRLARL